MKWLSDLLSRIFGTSPDPKYHCPLYRDCAHVDGPLCDVPTCPERKADIIPAFCPLPQDPAALLAKSQWEEKNVTAVMQVAANEAMTASDDRLRHLVLTTAAQLGIYPQDATHPTKDTKQ